MKKTIYLDAGHSTTDPGSITQYGKEADFNRKIRDIVVPKLLAYGFEVEQIPDELSLSESIKWVNDRAKNIDDGLALSLHCNCCGGDGAESYYYGQNAKSRELASKLLEGYCQETGLAKSNGGVRSDTTSKPGELGWIRKTKPWATLLEMIYIDNQFNVDFLINNADNVANGIVRGVLNIYGISYDPIKPEIPDKTKEEIKADIIKLLEKL